MRPTAAHYALADLIIDWLRERNAAELWDAFDAMKVGDARTMREELALILAYGGRPPNWTTAPSPRQKEGRGE